MLRSSFCRYFCGNLYVGEGNLVKEYTSKFLKAIAWVYLLFPFTYITYAALLFNMSFSRCVHIFFTPSYWLLSAFAIVTGYGLKEMHRWSWNAFLVSTLFTAYANALIAIRYSDSNNKFLAFVVSIGMLIIFIFQIGKEIKVPYFMPKIRWWESNPRYRLTVPARVERSQSGFEGEILDLSLGGCFIKSRMDVDQSEHLLIRFTIFGEAVELGGTVVWRSQNTVTHPKGMGIKFDDLNKAQKKVLKAATVHLKKIAHLQDSKNKISQEDFVTRMEELRTHQLKLNQDKEQAS